MNDNYTAFFTSNKRDMREVSDYIGDTLRGVSPDRIVSVTHAMALGEGPPPVMFYSALVVVRD